MGTRRFSTVKEVQDCGVCLQSVFWDNRSVLLVDMTLQGATINAAACCEITTRLRTVVKRKRLGLLRKGVLSHSNGRLYSAMGIHEIYNVFGERKWSILCLAVIWRLASTVSFHR
jgi:hypothetical protein